MRMAKDLSWDENKLDSSGCTNTARFCVAMDTSMHLIPQDYNRTRFTKHQCHTMCLCRQLTTTWISIMCDILQDCATLELTASWCFPGAHSDSFSNRETDILSTWLMYPFVIVRGRRSVLLFFFYFVFVYFFCLYFHFYFYRIGKNSRTWRCTKRKNRPKRSHRRMVLMIKN